jgi:hypothetical protein
MGSMVSGEWQNGGKETVVCSPTNGHQWQEENENEKEKREEKKRTRSDGRREREGRKEIRMVLSFPNPPLMYFNDVP